MSVLALVSVSVADSATHTKEIIGTLILTWFSHTKIKSNRPTWLNLLLATEWVRLVLLLLLCSSKNIKSLRLLQSLIGLGEWIAIIPKLVCSLLLRVLLHWLLELSRRRSSEHVALLLISELISLLLGLYLLWLDRNVSFCLSERVKICGCRLQLGKLVGVGCDRRRLKLSNSERIHRLWLMYFGWRCATRYHEWVVSYSYRLLR